MFRTMPGRPKPRAHYTRPDAYTHVHGHQCTVHVRSPSTSLRPTRDPAQVKTRGALHQTTMVLLSLVFAEEAGQLTGWTLAIGKTGWVAMVGTAIPEADTLGAGRCTVSLGARCAVVHCSKPKESTTIVSFAVNETCWHTDADSPTAQPRRQAVAQEEEEQ